MSKGTLKTTVSKNKPTIFENIDHSRVIATFNECVKNNWERIGFVKYDGHCNPIEFIVEVYSGSKFVPVEYIFTPYNSNMNL